MKLSFGLSRLHGVIVALVQGCGDGWLSNNSRIFVTVVFCALVDPGRSIGRSVASAISKGGPIFRHRVIWKVAFAHNHVPGICSPCATRRATYFLVCVLRTRANLPTMLTVVSTPRRSVVDSMFCSTPPLPYICLIPPVTSSAGASLTSSPTTTSGPPTSRPSSRTGDRSGPTACASTSRPRRSSTTALCPGSTSAR